MQDILVEKQFQFSEDTYTVLDFAPGEHTVSDLCASYARTHGFTVEKGEAPVASPEDPAVEAPVASPEDFGAAPEVEKKGAGKKK